jgi:hypothetical protein
MFDRATAGKNREKMVQTRCSLVIISRPENGRACEASEKILLEFGRTLGHEMAAHPS